MFTHKLILAYKRNIFHFSFLILLFYKYLWKKLSKQDLCYNLEDHMIWGVVCLGWNCHPRGLFCHILACGVMHLSYLAHLSSHINCWRFKWSIPNCNDFWTIIYHHKKLSAVKKLSTLVIIMLGLELSS